MGKGDRSAEEQTAQIPEKQSFTSSAAHGTTSLLALCIHTSHWVTGTGRFPVGKHGGTTDRALRGLLLYIKETNEGHPTTGELHMRSSLHCSTNTEAPWGYKLQFPSTISNTKDIQNVVHTTFSVDHKTLPTSYKKLYIYPCKRSKQNSKIIVVLRGGYLCNSKQLINWKTPKKAMLQKT